MVKERPRIANAYEAVHAYTTSTLSQFVEDQTKAVSGRGGNTYNPDVAIPQNPALRIPADIYSPLFREKLLLNSPFLRAHTEDILEEVIRRGWKYAPKGSNLKKQIKDWQHTNGNITGQKPPFEDKKNLMELEEWPVELQTAFVDAVSKGLCVGTSYLTMFNKGDETNPRPDYRVFTQNNEYKIFGNEARLIEEVYFRYPRFQNLYRKANKSQYFGMNYIGFLTQHSKLTVDDAFMDITKLSGLLNSDKKVRRLAVIIQPKPSIEDVHGTPKMLRECQTAFEKLALRNYEFCIIDKGGIKRDVVVPENMDEAIKDVIVTDVQRGVKSPGIIMEVAGGKPQDLVYILPQPIPQLPLNELNSHLSEDAQLSKQGIEGAAETGALGGQAPKENAVVDETVLENMYRILDQIIKDINYVFFDQDPQGYEIVFLPNPESMQQPPPDPNADTEGPEYEADTEMHSLLSNLQGIKQEAVECAHSINDQYIVFEGNMFQAGTFLYPESGTSEYYSETDIQRLCQRDVRQGYMDIDHASHPVDTSTTEGIGYFHTLGYDPVKRADRTQFFIRKNIYEQLKPVLPENGKRLILSPHFHRIRNPDGSKDVFIDVCTIVLHGQSRAEYSGLETSAVKKER